MDSVVHEKILKLLLLANIIRFGIFYTSQHSFCATKTLFTDAKSKILWPNSVAESSIMETANKQNFISINFNDNNTSSYLYKYTNVHRYVYKRSIYSTFPTQWPTQRPCHYSAPKTFFSTIHSLKYRTWKCAHKSCIYLLLCLRFIALTLTVGGWVFCKWQRHTK